MANVEHSVLTGTDLHESKGVAAAAANRVFVTDGAASGSFQQVPAAAIASAGVLVFQSQFYHIRDERSSGTGGDTLSNNAWTGRVLNTEKTDDLSITTTSNQMLLVAGTYYVEAEAIVNFTGSANRGGVDANLSRSKLRLRNITDSTTLVVGMSSKWSSNDDGGGSNQNVNIPLLTTLCGRFTLTGSKSVGLETWALTLLGSATITGGLAISSGENEVYADVKIWKLA